MYKIENLIPHRGRMKLVERIIDVDEESAVTTAVVSKNWPLFNGNSVNPVIFIELIAQTAGVATGNKSMKESGKGAEGWLVGIKKADFYTEGVQPGVSLTVFSKLLYERENYAVFEGTVSDGDDLLFKSEIQLFRSG